MPLPKINTPTYELELPSSKRKIKYRPFLVKEEKILIIAMESEDQKQITNAIKTVIIPPLNPHEPLNQSNLLNVH